MGGMEKLLTEFARHADRDRFELQFISLTGRGDVANEIEGQGWPVTVLRKRPGFAPQLMLRLARLFRRSQVDVVHTHNEAALLYAAPAARLARVAAVLHTRHGQSFHVTHRQATAFWLGSYLADRVVCVSRATAALSEEQGIPRNRIMTVWNGIDLCRFPYRGPNPGGPIVMVGRMAHVKDVGTLLRATALAVKQQPQLRLEIAGDGEELPALQQLAKELCISEQVTFLGQIDDIPGLLSRASLLALSSLSEGVSLTLLEAMAAGLPVVATRVGGNPEVVVEGETGLLVPSQSPEKLAEALVHLQADPELARRMGQAGRSRVEHYFDVRRMVRDYEGLYESLTGHRTGPALAAPLPDGDGVIVRS
jgi:glycosyltransferase involved in cell wall biosynthesis